MLEANLNAAEANTNAGRRISGICILMTSQTRIIFAAILLMLTFGPPAASMSANDTKTPQDVTVCELASDSEKYDRKLVKVTGRLSHGFEDSSLFDPDCPTGEHIWFEYGGKKATGTIYCCGISSARTRKKQLVVDHISIPLRNDLKFRRLDRLLHSGESSVVRATIVGQFFSAKVSGSPTGGTVFSGYGHLGCCNLFVVQQVISVDGFVN